MLCHQLAPSRHLQVLTDPRSMAQPCIIGSVPESKVEGGTGAGVKHFESPDVLPIKLKRRAKIKKERVVIRAGTGSPSHSVTA